MLKNKHKNSNEVDLVALNNTIGIYNQWWDNKNYEWKTPVFKRDYFYSATQSIEEKHGLALLINGPRRVGKTTIMLQLVEYLMKEKGIHATHVLFFSLDDPILQQLPKQDQGAGFEKILARWEEVMGTRLSEIKTPIYCFLDEVQKLPNWELYIKRYIDLKYPIRFVISGSASHTIFRKSLESLIGRLVDMSIPPFTFREWVRFHHEEYVEILEWLRISRVDIRDRKSLEQILEKIVSAIGGTGVLLLDRFAGQYAQAGGFPQLWDQSSINRAEFVDLQFVQRVTLEDLRLIKEIRRPEVFHQFLRYAFARTGEEYNLEDLAGKLKTTRVTLSGALPLLLQTELIRKVEKFTGKPVRLRSTHAKLYAADTLLFGAITKTSADLTGENKGRIAETLVYNTLRRFAGITDISYFRSPKGAEEVDFIVRIGKALIPLEVKYRRSIEGKDTSATINFLKEYAHEGDFGILVTEQQYDIRKKILEIPLGLFLLLG